VHNTLHEIRRSPSSREIIYTTTATAESLLFEVDEARRRNGTHAGFSIGRCQKRDIEPPRNSLPSLGWIQLSYW
jgi:hypothetical protein